MDFIYLDNNATTRPAPEVVEAMTQAQRELWANPSSIHRPGQAARQQVELARKHCAELIGVKPKAITFTGSGTEAIDLAIRGTIQAASGGRSEKRPLTLVTDRVEHAAVRELAESLEKREGVRVLWTPVGSGGVVDVDALESLLTTEPAVALVSVQWANNETGAIQPVARISELCRRKGVLFHCDATQWVGKAAMPKSDEVTKRRSDEVKNQEQTSGTGVPPVSSTPPLPLPDLLTYSPHKFHGPKGVGVLAARPGLRLVPQILGMQEQGRRGGTENVPGIIGAGVAARLAMDWLQNPAEQTRLAALRDRFEAKVLTTCPGAAINGPTDHPGEPVNTRRLWNTTNIAFPRLEAEALLLLLSEQGVCASAGAACSSGSLDPSPVLLAMGIPPEQAHGSLRFSLSRETTQAELDQAADIIAACVAKLRKSMPENR